MIHKNVSKAYRIGNHGHKVTIGVFKKDTDLPTLNFLANQGITGMRELTFINYDDAVKFVEWWNANKPYHVYIHETRKTYDLIDIDLGDNLGKACLNMNSLKVFNYLPDYILHDLFIEPDLGGYKNIIKRIADWINSKGSGALILIEKKDFNELYNYLYDKSPESKANCAIFCSYVRYIAKNFK